MSRTGRAIRGGALLALAAAGACTPRRTYAYEDGVYTIDGVASVESFRCAQSAVTAMGYHISWYDGGEETLRAERRFDDSAESYRGFLTVSVTDQSSGRMLFVRAERLSDGRLPVSRPTPQPTPVPVPVPRPGASRGPRRVQPGPVASHARDVVRRCSGGNAAAG